MFLCNNNNKRSSQSGVLNLIHQAFMASDMELKKIFYSEAITEQNIPFVAAAAIFRAKNRIKQR